MSTLYTEEGGTAVRMKPTRYQCQGHPIVPLWLDAGKQPPAPCSACACTCLHRRLVTALCFRCARVKPTQLVLFPL